MGVKKKILISVCLFLVVAIAVVAIVMFAPLPMKIKWNTIYDVGSNVKLLEAGETGNPTNAAALIKYNADGSIDTSDWKVL